MFNISQKVADDTIFRINKLIDGNTKNIIEKAYKKSIEKLIFCLRDNMKVDDFKNFIDIIEKKYLDEDI